MTDSIKPVRSSSHMASSALLPPSHDPDSSAIRPRNRRLISTDDDSVPTSSLGSTGKSTFGSDYGNGSSRDASPLPSSYLSASRGAQADGRHATSRRASPGAANSGRGLLDTSWSQSWASVQGFASSLLTGGGSSYDTGWGPSNTTRNGNQSRTQQLRREFSNTPHKASGTWGPEPPSNTRPRAQDIAAGSLAEREATLKAVRTASVLESHEGVNGGLDVTGKFKRRTSDDIPRDLGEEQEVQEYLVYIHHVQPNDTYAGIVLKYKCHEDAFRKANGLWSRDNIQIRKWLALPVDACEIRGRPSEPPSSLSQGVDLLAPTPEPVSGQERNGSFSQQQQVDFFSLPTNGSSHQHPKAEEQAELPWTHVRWVTLDSQSQPVEIGRVSRKTMGYFPPRRKKSIHTVSTLSTPRQSLDVLAIAPGSVDTQDHGSGPSSRRHSLLSNRPQLPGTPGRPSPATSRARMGSAGTESRPAWMRRPGGVGSLGKSVRAPGPEKDYFNSWTRKHLPGLNIESLPSMSVMGSETANFGFRQESAGIVESPFDDGQDHTANSRQGTGLDRAAAAVETWLRGAFAKRPSTPTLGSRNRQLEDLDLIELADAHSDDGRILGSTSGDTNSGLLSSAAYGSSGRSDGDGPVRGRILGSTTANSKGKAD